jgi:pimeloyl-ACP methyl ester carboxylesterase
MEINTPYKINPIMKNQTSTDEAAVIQSNKGHSKLSGYSPALLLLMTIIGFSSCASSKKEHMTTGNKEHLILREQGSFAVGGKVKTNPGTFDAITRTPEGQSFRGDHAYVFYQIPAEARTYPLVMWHGFGQFSKTWESTPDGREGFQNIFLRRRFPVYLIDQPRRGNAGRSMAEANISPAPDEQFWFNVFRVGVWPDYFPGVQFSKKPEALNQYFRQMTPDIGPIDIHVNVEAVSALFNRIGSGILVTHSHSGGMGWQTAVKNRNIKAIISYEPGSGFIFPDGEVPPPIESSSGPLEAFGVPKEDFLKLTEIPIIIYYGDNIPSSPDPNPGTDGWRVRLEMARLWRDAVNRYGGDVTVIHLPEIGITGNTHFPFSDLNNVEIADLMSDWMKEKNLNQ